MGDLPGKLEISTSPRKLIALLLGGVVLVAVSFLLAFRIIPDAASDSFDAFIGYSGLVFFSLCVVAIIKRLLTAHGVVVTMDSHGLRDTRISDKVIPWSAVREISTWQTQKQRIMIVAVDPAFERGLHLSGPARMTLEASRALGADGLAVNANDLRIDYDTLFATTRAFWKANA